MNLGMIFLKSNVLGFITLQELDWITENENSFSRVDMALVIKLNSLSIIQLILKTKMVKLYKY